MGQVNKLFLVLGFCFILSACAAQASNRKGVPPTSPPESDAGADAALGVLPQEGKTEAEKKAQEIDAEGETDLVLEEARRRRSEEEEERLRQAITSYNIAEQQN